ncbi:MAG: thioredoxin family protein [Bacteroidales bacterium]|nr:thioredoxin family protein [Bacteroidales bacterium]
MMKRLCITIAAVFLSVLSASAQELDSLEFDRYRGLDSLLTQFYYTLEREDPEVKGVEFDGLIETCKDSLTRQHVTLQIFDHYRYSRLMGDETVAVHIFDNWLANGRVKTRSEFEMMDAELFANFNRESLIGMDAPRIELFKPCGGRKAIPSEGRISVLFFYDTSCGKCRLETQVLPTIVKEVDFPFDFYAIYVGTDRREWNAFRRNFRLKNKNIRLIHLWDPEIDSGYQKAYGVTGTPRLFVVEPDGVIIGRRLEMTNLMEMFPVLRAVWETYEKYK